jgi:hypothetical protein
VTERESTQYGVCVPATHHNERRRAVLAHLYCVPAALWPLAARVKALGRGEGRVREEVQFARSHVWGPIRPNRSCGGSRWRS